MKEDAQPEWEPTQEGISEVILAITSQVTKRRIEHGAENSKKHFGRLGVDSVTIFELQLQIEKRFAITLPDNFLLTHDTPAAAAAQIAALNRLTAEEGS